MSNSSNYTDYGNLTKNEAWRESGAMVYVAMTITLLSSILMCCVWFVKRKIHKSGYGTVNLDEDRVELTSAVAFSDEPEKEEEDPTGQPTTEGVVAGQPVATFDDTKDDVQAFTLEDGSSSEEEVELGLGNNVAPV